jgi:hypothetical protein
MQVKPKKTSVPQKYDQSHTTQVYNKNGALQL